MIDSIISTLKQRINLTGFITVFIIQTGFANPVRFDSLGLHDTSVFPNYLFATLIPVKQK